MENILKYLTFEISVANNSRAKLYNFVVLNVKHNSLEILLIYSIELWLSWDF